MRSTDQNSTDQTFASIVWLKRGFAGLRAIGPYAAIELRLPGGSLMALGLWLFQKRFRRNKPRIPGASRFQDLWRHLGRVLSPAALAEWPGCLDLRWAYRR